MKNLLSERENRVKNKTFDPNRVSNELESKVLRFML